MNDVRGFWATGGRNRRVHLEGQGSTESQFRWRLLSIMFLGGLVGVGFVVVQYASRHAYFSATQISYSMGGSLPRHTVEKWGGIGPGMNLIALDAEKLERRLASHPWIRSAAVSKRFPGGVHIEIEERNPIAFLRTVPSTYLDESGESFAAPFAATRDLPYISGLERVPLSTQTARNVMAMAGSLLASMRELGISVSEVHWSAQLGYTIFLADRRVVVRAGHSINSSFPMLKEVLRGTPRSEFGVILDARFANQIVESSGSLAGAKSGVDLTRTL